MAPAFETIGTALAVNFTVNTLILAVVLACLSGLRYLPATRFLALAASVTLGGYSLDITFLSPYWRSNPGIFFSDPGEVYLQMALCHPHKALYMAADPDRTFGGIQHAARFEVSETRGVPVLTTDGPSLKALEFNRPFLFAIRNDRTHALYLLGLVRNVALQPQLGPANTNR